MAFLGPVAKLAKAPVSKTGDSRFESWLARFLALGRKSASRVGIGGGEQIDWDLLVPPPHHPTKVIIELMLWIEAGWSLASPSGQ
jgi:hypothetical protein